MTLSQQLNYNWERGFYSVVKDNRGNFIIFSTKDEYGSLRRTLSCESMREAMEQIGDCEGIHEELFPGLEKTAGWKLIDSINPSELMGKGFQVGDKVKINEGKYIGSTGEVMEVNLEGKSYAVKVEGHDQCGWPWVFQNEIKPVLPKEEDHTDYQCPRCSRPWYQQCACPKKEYVAHVSEPQKEEKKECEHDWKEENYTNHYYEAENERKLWLCDKCGLVTCLDPNRSRLSKNPNQEWYV